MMNFMKNLTLYVFTTTWEVSECKPSAAHSDTIPSGLCNHRPVRTGQSVWLPCTTVMKCQHSAMSSRRMVDSSHLSSVGVNNWVRLQTNMLHKCYTTPPSSFRVRTSVYIIIYHDNYHYHCHSHSMLWILQVMTQMTQMKNQCQTVHLAVPSATPRLRCTWTVDTCVVKAVCTKWDNMIYLSVWYAE